MNTPSSASDHRRSFAKNVGAFTSATMLSRLLGYARDALVANYFGGGAVTDAFYAAFKVPNLLRRFMGEGSMTAAFVPVFTDTLNRQGQEEAGRLFHALGSGLVVILSVIVLLGMVFSDQVTRMVAWGFVRSPEVFQLTSELVRLTLPFLVLVSLAALVTAVLNASNRFFVPAVAPSGLSVAEIGFILLIARFLEVPVKGLALSVVVGGALHLLWQLPTLYRQGYRIRIVKPFAHPGVKTVFLLMIPTILGLAADQINTFVDQICASFLETGSITALYNSNRVMQLPLALFGVAVASVALPALSRSMTQGDTAAFKDLLGFSLRTANFVLIPSFFGLVVLGLPIIELLFEHGRFTPEASRLTYAALAPYALGLPAYSMIRILASAFYARKNTRTPMKVAFWAMGLHVVLNLLLMWEFRVAGLAFSTAVSAWFQAVVLFALLRKEIGPFGGRALATSFLKGLVIGAAMAALCGWLAYGLLLPFHNAIRVFVSMAAGGLFYFQVSRFFRIKEFEFFVGTLFHRRLP